MKKNSPSPTVWVGLSGGADSVVLLHFVKHTFFDKKKIGLLYQQCKLKAIHVNHQILPEAKSFESFCKQLCQQWEIELDIIRASVSKKPGESLEAIARETRYSLIEKKLGKNDILLTAHHLDDQAETFLLQLLRGAGLKGISAMPSISRLGKGFLLRPFLAFSQENILQYADYYQLEYVNDPSNQDASLDRNYLRHAVIPLIKQRWPKMTSTFSRFSKHSAEQEKILALLAQQDLANCLNSPFISLKLSVLHQLPIQRQKNVLRYWISFSFSFENTPLPEKILDQLLLTFFAAQDKNPLVKATLKVKNIRTNIEFRRFKEDLHLLSGSVLKPRPLTLTQEEKAWCQQHIKEFEKNRENYIIRFRKSGERAWCKKSSQHKSLKKLFQEWNIPPWQRNRIPLIYFRQTLLAVVGYGVF